ncbi:JAB domain-containing protein [Sphingomonas sp. ST-64]|uniref:JAB domain-containing protein n=1 Tax=Sphingomonas plantiphila TaxID=3163295 RepID=A0ABW8YI32_9SPHN
MAGESCDPTPDSRFGALANLLAASIAAEPREVAAFAYCDPAGRVLGTLRIASADSGSLDLPVRRIVADAVLLDAPRVVMAHNHPSGDASPSRADRAATSRMARAFEAIESRLVDHVVVGRGGAVWSFRAAGLL